MRIYTHRGSYQSRASVCSIYKRRCRHRTAAVVCVLLNVCHHSLLHVEIIMLRWKVSQHIITPRHISQIIKKKEKEKETSHKLLAWKNS